MWLLLALRRCTQTFTQATPNTPGLSVIIILHGTCFTQPLLSSDAAPEEDNAELPTCEHVTRPRLDTNTFQTY